MKHAFVLAIVACSRRDPIASCDDDLRGVYATGDERWMMIDRGDILEAYPLFPDGAGPTPDGSMPGSADLVVAPRVIDFQRAAAGSPPGSGAPGALRGEDHPASAGRPPLAGTLRRRYMRRAERCDAHVPVHITRCSGDTLELVLADPAPPIGYSPCTWSRPGPSRLVRWQRE